MRSRIPARHRLRHLALYSRIVLTYNVAASALGVTALLILRRAGLMEGEVSLRVGLTVGGLILMTGGHWVAVLIFGLAHHNEYALFRAGGWGPTGLRLASWLAAAIVGAGVALSARLAGGL